MLNVFFDKWKTAKDINGVKAFTSNTNQAIENLKQHVVYGCLSEIPTGGGTNRNERFHHHINSVLHRNKIGILMAIALLTIVIHAYNSSKKINSRHVIEPISFSKLRSTSNTTASELPSIGIMPKERPQVDQCNTTYEIDVTNNLVDLSLVITIYKRAYMKIQLLRSFAQMGLLRLTKNVKHFVSFNNLQSQAIPSHPIDESLNRMLQENGLQYTPVAGDGNCFFRAMAINIQRNPTQWYQTLSFIGVTNVTSLSNCGKTEGSIC